MAEGASDAGAAAIASLYLSEKADETAIQAAVADGTLRLVDCPEQAKTADRVGAEVARLLSDGLSPGDIGIVSLRGQSAEGAVHQRERIGRHAFVPADASDMDDNRGSARSRSGRHLDDPCVFPCLPHRCLGAEARAKAHPSWRRSGGRPALG